MNKNMDLNNFDYNEFKTEALEKIKSGQPLTGKGGILTPLLNEHLAHLPVLTLPEMHTVAERYIEKPVFFVRPTSHLWVASPEHLYALFQTALDPKTP